VIGLLQRVCLARVLIDDKIVAAIERGLLVLVGIERGDDERHAERLLERILGYRLFPDDAGKMNLSVQDIDGGLLLVPNFTLAADTRKGMRPSFTTTAVPAEGERLFRYLTTRAEQRYHRLQSGIFGAHMELRLTNDGPVVFWLQTR
jgi:D-tyrosyl-tRNA(Tyr) deacylase